MSAEIFDSPTTAGSETVVTYPVGQPLIFSIQDTGTTPDRFVVRVTGYDVVTGGSGVVEAKLYLTPNANGKAFFDLSKIAQSRLQAPTTQKGDAPYLPFAGEPIHSLYSIDAAVQRTCRRYKVEVARYNNGAEGSYTSNKTIYVIHGSEQPTSGLFPNFVGFAGGGSTGWLTDQKKEPSDLPSFTGAEDVIRKRLVKYEEQTIGLLSGFDIGYPLSASATDYAWTITAQTSTGNVGNDFYSLNSSGSLTSPFGNRTADRVLFSGLGSQQLRAYLILRLGPSGLNQIPDPDNIDKAMITLYGGAAVGNVGSKVLVTWDDDDLQCRNGFTQLAFMNTRGAYDYLRFDNRTPKRITTEGKQYRKSLNDYNGSTFTMDGQSAQYETYAKSARRQYTISSLFFTDAEREMVEIAMRSKFVQIRRVDAAGVSVGWEPATIITSSVVIEPSGSRFYNVSLDVEVAQDIRC